MVVPDSAQSEKDSPAQELERATQRVLDSAARRKLIVAGPGTGKTTLFKKLLEATGGYAKQRLVLTFINNLKNDLERDLGHLASVFTLHGYCQAVLHKRHEVRGALTTGFRCIPGLASVIKSDWTYIKGGEAPHFVHLMRNLEPGPETDFYLSRGDYYDAVDFDDSVFRVERAWFNGAPGADGYELVLIDEFQDFNALEASIIEHLATHNSIVVAGDDDQALYAQLRGASSDYIRTLHQRGDYEIHELPFCMRCPSVIVDAVNDILAKARDMIKLTGRISKPYRTYEPVKGEDSRRYPKLGLVHCSVQKIKANYFGKYIAEQLMLIPDEELRVAKEKGDIPALVIGQRQYLKQIAGHLAGNGFIVEMASGQAGEGVDRLLGIELLAENRRSNVGWRIILEHEPTTFARKHIQEAATSSVALIDVLPEDFIAQVLVEVSEKASTGMQADEASDEGSDDDEDRAIRVRLTSFEGAKGLSAYHVFIVGMHDGEFPRDTQGIQDIEICRLLVGLTRAKKKCSLLYTDNFSGQWKRPSTFIGWIDRTRFEYTKVQASYWRS